MEFLKGYSQFPLRYYHVGATPGSRFSLRLSGQKQEPSRQHGGIMFKQAWHRVVLKVQVALAYLNFFQARNCSCTD